MVNVPQYKIKKHFKIQRTFIKYINDFIEKKVFDLSYQARLSL
jgi:hypothetical protein